MLLYRFDCLECFLLADRRAPYALSRAQVAHFLLIATVCYWQKQRIAMVFHGRCSIGAGRRKVRCFPVGHCRYDGFWRYHVCPFRRIFALLLWDERERQQMEQQHLELLQRLIEVPGPSGYEEQVQQVWIESLPQTQLEVQQNVHGSVAARYRGTASEFTVLLGGHADEIALVVNYISDDGMLYCKSIGGIDPAVLPAQPVRIFTATGVVNGVIGAPAVHLLSDEERGKARKLHELWVDIGAKDKAEAESLVQPGDPVIVGGGFMPLAGNRAAARCFDNRVGIFIVSRVLNALVEQQIRLPFDVVGVSTVQEETSMTGIKTAGFALNPHVGIIYDVMVATDFPGVDQKKFGVIKVGAGVGIARGVRTDRRLADLLIKLAKEAGIPYQVEVERGWSSTDADPLTDVRQGVATTILSVATRYLHTSWEVLDLEDIEAAVQLTLRLLQSEEFVQFLQQVQQWRQWS